MVPAAAGTDSGGTPSCFTDWTSFEVGGRVVEVLRLMFGGREVCRAFSYNPHALQIILPLISRLHSGVDVVPQFLEYEKWGCLGGKYEQS